MSELLGLVLISFAVTSFLLVPFIDLLFYLKRRLEKNNTVELKTSETPIHDKLMKDDEGVPSGGGILLILVLIILSSLFSFFINIPSFLSLGILIFTLVVFGGLGFVDDFKQLTVKRSGKFLGLGRTVMILAQVVFSLIIASMLYFGIGFNNIYLPIFGNIILGFWYIPLAAFIIISFTNAYNISDGLDGLSTGLLTICLFAFLALASAVLNQTLSIFVGVWIGTLIAYLYFNVYPARIYLGDAGAFSFGATLAVVGLLTGKILGLGIIGGMYVIIVASSLLQIFWKKFFKRKLFPVAPIHMYFKYIGWEEPKIVVRFWLAGAIFAIFGLWLALLYR